MAVEAAGFEEFHFLDLVVSNGQVHRGRPMFIDGKAVFYDDVVVKVGGQYAIHEAVTRGAQR
jgi:prefoldin subunit 5